MSFPRRLHLFFLSLAFAFGFAAPARADLQVFPTRVLFEGGMRSGQLHLKHFGTKPTRYRISMVFYQMGQNGELKALANAALKDGFAGDILRYSPRMVSLSPGEEQIVRVQLRKPADLASGEYRAHIQFETFDEDDAVDMGKGADSASGVSMTLKAHRAIAIPLIVRNGELKADLALKGAVVKKSGKDVSFNVQADRKGNRSVYGNLQIVSTSSIGESLVLKEVKGLSFYNESRNLSIPLDSLPKSTPNTRLFVTFIDTDKNTTTVPLTVDLKE